MSDWAGVAITLIVCAALVAIVYIGTSMFGDGGDD